MCVIFVRNTLKLTQMSEFPPNLLFSVFKKRLLTVGFNVYEFLHNQGRRLPPDRQVMLTHLAFRDEAQCTNAVVSKVLVTKLRGHSQSIDSDAVIVLNQQLKHVSRPAIPQTSSSSAFSEAASGWPQKATNIAFQQPPQ